MCIRDRAITKKANVTVSDDEAKTVKVYKLVFTTKTTDSKTGKEKDMTAAEKKDQLKKAKSALKMIKKGQSVSSVAKKFSVNSDNEESYTKGKSALGDKFETDVYKRQALISPIFLRLSRKVACILRFCFALKKIISKTITRRMMANFH